MSRSANINKMTFQFSNIIEPASNGSHTTFKAGHGASPDGRIKAEDFTITYNGSSTPKTLTIYDNEIHQGLVFSKIKALNGVGECSRASGGRCSLTIEEETTDQGIDMSISTESGLWI